jgi:hypothetical protein
MGNIVCGATIFMINGGIMSSEGRQFFTLQVVAKEDIRGDKEEWK